MGLSKASNEQQPLEAVRGVPLQSVQVSCGGRVIALLVVVVAVESQHQV
jgi:hypothetical protein